MSRSSNVDPCPTTNHSCPHSEVVRLYYTYESDCGIFFRCDHINPALYQFTDRKIKHVAFSHCRIRTYIYDYYQLKSEAQHSKQLARPVSTFPFAATAIEPPTHTVGEKPCTLRASPHVDNGVD